MYFSDYKQAAERHLTTCLNLSQLLTQFDNKQKSGGISSKDEESQNHLLSNLYYLSGYMVECIYSYAMCKYENNRMSISHPIDADVKTILDTKNSSTPYIHTYKICFMESKRATNKLNVRYSISRERHQMSLSELSFFEIEGIIATGDIALFDNVTPLSNNDVHNLFLNWTAYERYKINHFDEATFPAFTYINVISLFWELVETCAKLSTIVLRENTLFNRIIKKKPTNF